MMNSLKKYLLPIAALTLSTQVMANGSYLTPTVEKGLIKVCKTAAKDQFHQMNLTMKKHNWSYRLMALNVMCNGQDLISFAETHGAKKTTARLSRSVGSTRVIDIASAKQYNYSVTFEAN